MLSLLLAPLVYMRCSRFVHECIRLSEIVSIALVASLLNWPFFRIACISYVEKQSRQMPVWASACWPFFPFENVPDPGLCLHVCTPACQISVPLEIPGKRKIMILISSNQV